MRVFLDNNELSLIPETDEERQMLIDWVSKLGTNTVDASFEGQDQDELVFSPC